MGKNIDFSFALFIDFISDSSLAYWGCNKTFSTQCVTSGARLKEGLKTKSQRVNYLFLLKDKDQRMWKHMSQLQPNTEIILSFYYQKTANKTCWNTEINVGQAAACKVLIRGISMAFVASNIFNNSAFLPWAACVSIMSIPKLPLSHLDACFNKTHL